MAVSEMDAVTAEEPEAPARDLRKMFPRPGAKPEGLIGHLFFFLSSFWLAVFLLASILVASAVATIFEAQWDSGYAFYRVYAARWFEFLLVLLGITVIAAAFSRWPWQRRHTGFLITHLGIIIVLAGSAISRYAGWEGSLALLEGEKGHTVRTQKSLLAIQAPGDEGPAELPIQLKYKQPTKEHPYTFHHGDYSVTVDQFLANAKLEDVVYPGGDSFNPAVKIYFQAPVTDVEEWLILRNPRKNRINFGPAEFAFVQAQTEEELQRLLEPAPEPPSKARGKLLLTMDDGKSRSLNVAENFRKPIALIGRGSTLTITDFYKNVSARDHVVGGGPRLNEALKFVIYSSSQHEMRQEQWLFNRLPHRRRFDLGRIATVEMRVVNNEADRRSFLEPESFLSQYPAGQIRLTLKDGRRLTFPTSELQGKSVPIDGTDLKLEVNAYFPNATINAQTRRLENRKGDGKNTNPAVVFQISGPVTKEQHTLFANYPNLKRVHKSLKGPLVKDATFFLPASSGSHITLVCGPGKKLGYFCSSMSGGAVHGEMTPGKPVKTNWMGMMLVAERYEPKAVNKLKLTESAHAGPHGSSPAIRLKIQTPGGTQEHVAFGSEMAKGMDTFYADEGDASGIRFLEYRAGEDKQKKGNSLTLVLGPDNSLYYRVASSKHENSSGKVELEKEIPVSWMAGAFFQVEQFIEKGKIRQEVVEDPSMGAGAGGHRAAIHARVKNVRTGQEAQDWVWWDARHSTSFKVGEGEVAVGLYNKTIDLAFDVDLIDFRDVRNPGGVGMASFESDVDVHDDQMGTIKKVTISMNYPLEYRGLLFFQSSYIKQEKQPDVSIFSVSYDPGIRVVYTGFSLICCGIFTMFYIKPWRVPSRRRKKSP